MRPRILQVVFLTIPIALSGCAKDCGGTFDKLFGRSDCQVASNSSTQSTGNNTVTGTETENKIAVSIDKSLMDTTEQYSLVSTVGTTKFDPTASSQVITTDSYTTEDVKRMTLVAVKNQFDESFMIAPITKDQKQITINFDTTADFILLSTAKMMGVRVTDYPEFIRRTHIRPEFQEIKDAIIQEINAKSRCPISCNSAAENAADRLMDQVDVTDIITAEGV